MTETETGTSFKTIEARLNKLESDHDNVKKKDFWDKLGSVSNFVATVVLAAAGLFINASFADRQSKREAADKEQKTITDRIDVATKLLGPIASGGTQKSTALVLMSSLGHARLATEIAESDADDDSVLGLEAIARSDNTQSKELASISLKRLAERRETLGQCFNGTWHESNSKNPQEWTFKMGNGVLEVSHQASEDEAGANAKLRQTGKTWSGPIQWTGWKPHKWNMLILYEPVLPCLTIRTNQRWIYEKEQAQESNSAATSRSPTS